MKVVIHTMFEKLYEDEAREVVLPGEDGEFSVWDFHQYCLYSLRRGWVRVIPRNQDKAGPKEEFKILIKRGVANVRPIEMDLLVER